MDRAQDSSKMFVIRRQKHEGPASTSGGIVNEDDSGQPA